MASPAVCGLVSKLGLAGVGAGLGSLSSAWLLGGGGGGGAGRACACCWGAGAGDGGAACGGAGCGAVGIGGPALRIASSCWRVFLSSVGLRDCARRSLSDGGACLGGVTFRWASGGRFRKVMSFCLLTSGLTTWTR